MRRVAVNGRARAGATPFRALGALGHEPVDLDLALDLPRDQALDELAIETRD